MRWDSRSVTLPPTGLPWGQEAAGTTEDVRPPGTPMPRWLFCDLQPLPCPLASAHLLCQVTSPCHIPGKALPASDSCRHPPSHRIHNPTHDTTSQQSWGPVSCLRLRVKLWEGACAPSEHSVQGKCPYSHQILIPKG